VLAFDEVFVGPDGLAVFELWADPDRWFVRPVGEASIEHEAACRLLTDWASPRPLEFGRALPERASAPAPVKLPFRFGSEPPTFRFVREPASKAVRVYPWGRGAERLVDFREDWEGALGDIVALDADRCEARFALVADPLRRSTEALLRRWAADDEWALEIRRGLEPLIALPDTSLAHPAESVCTECGSRLQCGFASALLFHQRGFHRTRCRLCGGRRVWFDQGRPKVRHREEERT
jgi:hypothetical protein